MLHMSLSPTSSWLEALPPELWARVACHLLAQADRLALCEALLTNDDEASSTTMRHLVLHESFAADVDERVVASPPPDALDDEVQAAAEALREMGFGYARSVRAVLAVGPTEAIDYLLFHVDEPP